MNRHVSIDDIQRAIHGQLSPDQESSLHEHMESCATCAAAMEQLCGADQLASEIPRLLAADEFGDLMLGPDEASMTDFLIEHLDPSDSPAALGQLGCYDVLEIVGHGGMGIVLKAHDRELKRLVAIKVLAPHLAYSAFARKRFAREAQAAAAVVNPHVIAIHQVQPNGRLPFLVMPLLTGQSLAQRLKVSGALELKEILRIGMQAADGLAAAHAQGLIHRDVKPANILLEKGVERAVLTDFGLARAADDVSMTRQGIIAGTPEYMSPEQARGETLDHRSDLFSLGCVLYEMASGISPFRTDSTIATLRRIVEEQPVALTSLVPNLPPWFGVIIERLLSKDPAKRFETASEVKQLLAQCLAHLQQPASVSLPVFYRLYDPMKITLAGALSRLLGLYRDLFAGRGITKGWPVVIHPKPPRDYSRLWALTVIPVWYFLFVAVGQTIFDLLNLVPASRLQSQNEILSVLNCSFIAFIWGLAAAQFSVAVTGSRYLRPVMSLWILILPYLLAKQVSIAVTNGVGYYLSLVPLRLTNETGSYLTIAILSAFIYSLVIRPESKDQLNSGDGSPQHQI